MVPPVGLGLLAVHETGGQDRCMSCLYVVDIVLYGAVLIASPMRSFLLGAVWTHKAEIVRILQATQLRCRLRVKTGLP